LRRDPLLLGVFLVAVAAVVIAVVMLFIGEGWGDGHLHVWDTWIGAVEKLATIVALAVAGYIAYRRLIGGGGALAARCTLELSARLENLADDAGHGLLVDCCIKNEGGLDLEMVGDAFPAVYVRALDKDQVTTAQGAASPVFPWHTGRELLGLPFRSPAGEKDHDDIEPGGTVDSSIAIPVPSHGGPYTAFLVRFVVLARNRGDTHEGWYWTADTVVVDAARSAGGRSPGDRADQQGDAH
jgi:hypothetical protein